MILEKAGMLASLARAQKNGIDITIEAEPKYNFKMFLNAVKADIDEEYTRALVAKYLLKKKEPEYQGKNDEQMKQYIEKKYLEKGIAKIKKAKGNEFTGWISMPVEFVGIIRVLADRAEFYGQIKGKLFNLFGIKGFNAADWKGSLIWDYALTAELAATVVGAIAPKGGSYGGELQFGKSKIHMDFKGNISGVTGFGELAWIGKGDLYLRDFLKVYMGVPTKIMTKKQKEITLKGINNFVNKYIPDWKLEGAEVAIVPKMTVIGLEKVKKQVNLKVDRIELFPKVGASANFKVTETGVTADGSVDPININLGALKLSLTGLKRDRASFEMNVTYGKSKSSAKAAVKKDDKAKKKTAGKVAIKVDGKLAAELGPLGYFETASYAKILPTKITMRGKTSVDLLGHDADITIKGDITKVGKLNPESFFFDATFTQKELTKLNKLLTTSGKKALADAKKALDAAEKKARSAIGDAVDKERQKIDREMQKVNEQIRAANAYCNKKFRKKRKGIGKLKIDVNAIPRRVCKTAKITPLQTKLGSLKIARDAILKGAKGVAQASTKAGMSAAKKAVAFADSLRKASAVLAKLTNQIMKQGFILEYFKVKGQFDELYMGQLPLIAVKGKVLGKQFSFSKRLNLADIESLPGQILRKIGVIK